MFIVSLFQHVLPTPYIRVRNITNPNLQFYVTACNRVAHGAKILDVYISTDFKNITKGFRLWELCWDEIYHEGRNEIFLSILQTTEEKLVLIYKRVGD